MIAGVFTSALAVMAHSGPAVVGVLGTLVRVYMLSGCKER